MGILYYNHAKYLHLNMYYYVCTYICHHVHCMHACVVVVHEIPLLLVYIVTLHACMHAWGIKD